jgi:uncharacterized protein YecE (DUF72 family)
LPRKHTLKTAEARLFAGTSGWAYATWKPGFYPLGVSSKKFLDYYASQLNTVEVNYTFRKLPTAAMVERWLAETGEGFRFSFKAPQRITHFNRLRECDGLVAEFIDALKPVAAAGKLGLVLFQLPPNFKADVPRLTTLLAAPALRGREAPRIAFEFRHDSWFTEETTEVLRKCDAAYCIAETDDLQTPEVHTAQAYTCFRLRRAGGYKPREIAVFARRFKALAAEREVYVYFRHEDEPTGALNATALLKKAAGR